MLIQATLPKKEPSPSKKYLESNSSFCKEVLMSSIRRSICKKSVQLGAFLCLFRAVGFEHRKTAGEAWGKKVRAFRKRRAASKE